MRARGVLKEVVVGFDQTLTSPLVSAYPEDAGPNSGIGTEDYWIEEQGKTLNMLRQREILTSVIALGYQGFRVEGDATIVREAYTRLNERLQPKRAPGTRASAPRRSGSQAVVFIGHGRSSLWRELQHFLEHRLNLKCVEFNTVSAAGIPTAERLTELLGEATFAFLVMTAEDEHHDGSQHARENVVHEVGLFQGRLGFKKAIILLEEGCTEFSNIHGLGQIRFAPGNISAAAEEIRRVLEREDVIHG